MRNTRTAVMASALAFALAGAGAAPAAAQQFRGGPPPGPDPFMQQDITQERDWYEGPMAQWYENRQGRQWDMNQRWRDNAERDAFERGYRQGRDEERMSRGGTAREDMARDWQDGRRSYGEARDQLDSARRQIERGDLRAAWVALGRAETRLITRATGRGADGELAAAGGAVGAIRDARQALANGARDRALDRVEMAQSLVRRGYIIGETVSGSRLSGAGSAGQGTPFGDRSSGSD